MKKMLTIGILLLSQINGNAQIFGWANATGGTTPVIVEETVIDKKGNLYTVGTFYGTADFNPSPVATYNLSTNANGLVQSTFIQKLDAAGNFVWAKALKGVNHYDGVNGYGISVDNNGNIFVTGDFHGDVDFDPSPNGFNNLYNFDKSFLLKLNNSGIFQWVQQIGDNGPTQSYGVKTNSNNDVFVVGSFQTGVNFNPNGPAQTKTSNGGKDIFIKRVDNNGNFVWVKTIGGTGNDVAQALTINNYQIYITGQFSGTVDFDPNAGVQNLNNGGRFIAKYRHNGNYAWAQNAGGTSEDHYYSIAADNSGNVYTAGRFSGTTSFNGAMRTATGGTDIFMQRSNQSNGNINGLITIGGTGNDGAYSVAVNQCDDVYITGYYSGQVDFDYTGGVNYLNSINGSSDIFLTKINGSNFNFEWAHSFGAISSDYGTNLNINAHGDIYLSGQFRNQVDFHLDPSITYNVSASWIDVFALKLNESPVTSNISQHPLSFTSGRSCEETMSVIAQGAQTYQWQIYVPFTQSFHNLTNNSIYSGVTTANLDISIPSFWSGFYRYRCIVRFSSCTPDEYSKVGELFINRKSYCDGNPTSEMVINKNTQSEKNTPEGFTQISVFPNPSLTGQYTINTEGFLEDRTINVIDLSGKVIMTYNGPSAKTIDISNFSKGIYFLKVSDHTQEIVEKIIYH